MGFQPGVPVKPMLAKATTGISEVRALPMCPRHSHAYKNLSHLQIMPCFHELAMRRQVLAEL